MAARRRSWAAGTVSALALALPVAAHADTAPVGNTVNLFGNPGLIDMPSAEMQPDAQFTPSISYFGGSARATLTFQATPRISGSFRYSILYGYNLGGYSNYADRSLDIKFLLAEEGRRMPAIAIGLRDFAGTGIYGGEYVVATKHVTPRLKFSLGMGWGRLGSYNGFSNPLGVISSRFKTRPSGTGSAGSVSTGKWFRGDAAFFGGVEWTVNDRFTLKAEYSSDAYKRETAQGMFVHRTPINVAVDYRFGTGAHATLAYMYGSEVGLMFSFPTNPRFTAFPSGRETAPTPIVPRAEAGGLGWGTEWVDAPGRSEELRGQVAARLAQSGLQIEALSLTATKAVLRFRNVAGLVGAEALGRAARALANTLPASVETLVLVPVVQGMPAAAVSFRRSDLEALQNEPDGNWQSYVRMQLSDAAGLGRAPRADMPAGSFPRLTWGLGPYARFSYFDPDAPVRADFGLSLSASYEVTPGVILSGELRKKAFGNLNQSTRVSDSVLPHVRSDFSNYDKQGDPAISYLTAEYFFRPGHNLFGRLTVGYLEEMYGGVSAELLWKPVNSRIAFGAEIDYVRKRAYDELFGFRSYKTTTGFLSAYYDFKSGYVLQVDVGRYLAGDVGATIKLERQFDNGWRIGGFVTKTDVSPSEFGEGSFDKGITLTIPLSSILGRPSPQASSTVIRPVQRDGGAQLNIRNRLYDLTRSYQDPRLESQWGRFWR